LPSPALRNEIDSLGSASDEYDFTGTGSVEKSSYFFASCLVSVGSSCCQLMRSAVNVRIFVRVKVTQTVDHCLRLLRGRGVIKPNKLPAIDAFLQDWKVSPDFSHFEDPRGQSEILWATWPEA
jgi:hypothetical protein